MKNTPESKHKNSIRPGSIWQLGKHRLACGDCRDLALMKKLLESERVNLLCTDPPYGVAVAESKRGFQTLAKDKAIVGDHLQSDSEYAAFSAEWLAAIAPHLAPHNAAYIFNADKMIWPLREGAIRAGFKVAQLLVWVKSQAVIGRLDYAPQHELVLYGWHGTHKFRRSKDKSVLFFPKPSKSTLHPTMKPVQLIARLILNSTSIDETVFDGFLGSGTTLIACEMTKRRCFGVELDPEYCRTIIQRWEKLTGNTAMEV